MKTVIRSILINSITIAILTLFLPAVSYQGKITTLVIAATTLGFMNTFVRPIVSLILLPINIITLGIIGWFISALMLLLTTLIVPNFNIIPFSITLGNGAVINISLFWSYVLTSFILNFIGSIVRSILTTES